MKTHWENIRKQARNHHNLARAALVTSFNEGDPVPASLLIKAAQVLTEIKPVGLPAGNSLLNNCEAVLDTELNIIWYNRDIEPSLISFYIAHEYGHFWLHRSSRFCDASDLDTEAVEAQIPLGIQRVEGYGPEERRELEANVFAREFLLPCENLGSWFLNQSLNAATIAERSGLPEGMVAHQLILALLNFELPPTVNNKLVIEEKTELQGNLTDYTLDPSQKEAAHSNHCPLLIEAGPGTGKTRTLVGRILHLIDQKEEFPASILSLTFSNKAAEEMRERIALIMPNIAPQLWMGTFHAFGLEMLRKYGTLLGLPSRPDVLDPIDSLFLLERELPSLPLKHYQNLYEPTINLRDILGAIGRAKDELVGPDEYMVLAQKMLLVASTPDSIIEAEKAIEVAQVYALYQARLEQEHLLDFGDLIAKSVILLKNHPNIKAQIKEKYRHILVDEYQDVNRASSILLREIAGAGEGLWVVGDARQAIYRFRGAAPINMRLFTHDFPSAKIVALRRNYRSQKPVIDTFALVASQMKASLEGQILEFESWEANRGNSDGRVTLEIAEDLEAEGTGLAQEIETLKARGVAYRDQAILCRSHTMLARYAALLDQAGVPTLYLGDLFERPEIRDLLSLIAFSCEGNGRSLVRVANFAEYNIALDDVKVLRAEAQKQNIPFPRALKLAHDNPKISDQGKQGFALLNRHLEDLCYGSNAWGLLVHYLFNRSNYLRTLLLDNSISNQQKRLAIYQFLQFAHQERNRLAVNTSNLSQDDTKIGEENTTQEGVKIHDPKLVFLKYIRRMAIFGEDKQLRQVPEEASNIDAVRLLTIHASKGLEFGAVYLPGLGSRYFPAIFRAKNCPSPIGMLSEGSSPVREAHDEEEECLFFVALSRARDFLCLSFAHRYGSQKSNPSKLLVAIEKQLPRRLDSPISWLQIKDKTGPVEKVIEKVVPVATPEVEEIPLIESALPIYDVEKLDLYIRCPRQFYYEVVLELGSRREDSIYIQFHRCVYDVLRWLREEQTQGRKLEIEAAYEYLAQVWQTKGPLNHPYEAIYRQNAELLVARALERANSTPVSEVEHPVWEIPLKNGYVRLKPDRVVFEVKDRKTAYPVIQRLRTGQASKSEQEKDIYALYQLAAKNAYPDKNPRVEVVYLSSDQTDDIKFGTQAYNNRIERYESAIAGIQSKAFSPLPSERECPRCPHYFICPAGE